MVSIPFIPTKHSSLTFLHLSDIHFRKKVTESAYDLDADLRHQLEIDAESVKDEIGKIDAIIVTGDVAFEGAAGEYLIAKEWLNKLSSIIECNPPIILTIPGNHDVDRTIYRDNIFLRNTLDSISKCNSDNEVNLWIQSIYSSQQSEEVLYLSINNYNHFAGELGCELSHKQQFWQREFELNNDIKINFRGLNSVLGSSSIDFPRKNLFLGIKQLELLESSRTLNVILCHHPPDWLIDNDQINTYLAERAHIQLFGHKHVQYIENINGNLRVTAGAVHPSRWEQGWLPRYNFIKISANDENSVKVTIHPRVWENTKFVTKYTDGKPYVENTFSFNPNKAATNTHLAKKIAEISSPKLTISDKSEMLINETSMIVSSENNMSNNSIEYGKILVRRFLNLDDYTQDKIVNALNLNTPSFSGMQETEIFKEIFQRAKTRNQLNQLWEMIEKEHGDNMFSENPFEGN